MLTWQRWSWRNRCVDNYWGSTLVRARWAELPGDPYQQFGCRMPRLQEIQAITHSFPKQKGRVQRSTARGQAVWVLCEGNVHIHIMYRHHDHLHGWISGFQKVLDRKDVVYLSKHHWAPHHFSFWVTQILSSKWSRGDEFLLTIVRLFCVPAQGEFMKCERSLAWLSEKWCCKNV